MRYMPTTRRMGGMILVESLASGGALDEAKGGNAPPGRDDPYLGRVGEVSADLRPAGKGMFDGQLLDIVADGEFIEKGTRVKVVRHEGSRIVVDKVGEN